LLSISGVRPAVKEMQRAQTVSNLWSERKDGKSRIGGECLGADLPAFSVILGDEGNEGQAFHR